MQHAHVHINWVVVIEHGAAMKLTLDYLIILDTELDIEIHNNTKQQLQCAINPNNNKLE
jgi:hypothetical protein